LVQRPWNEQGIFRTFPGQMRTNMAQEESRQCVTGKSGVVSPQRGSAIFDGFVPLAWRRTKSLETPMKKRARPKQNGESPIWMLARETLAVYGYDLARSAGDKHSEAVKEAVRLIRQIRPGMPISETEVRRIIAYWRSSRNSNGLLVSKPSPANCTFTLHDGTRGERGVDCRAWAASRLSSRKCCRQASHASSPTGSL
jgi:hypothetical protein